MATHKCSVCEDTIPKRTTHFGAVSCDPCRMFFTRMVASGENLVCSESGNCNVLCLDFRRRRFCCKACRYDKCLKMGMQPSLVNAGRWNNQNTEGQGAEGEDWEESPSTNNSRNSGTMGGSRWSPPWVQQVSSTSSGSPTSGKRESTWSRSDDYNSGWSKVKVEEADIGNNNINSDSSSSGSSWRTNSVIRWSTAAPKHRASEDTFWPEVDEGDGVGAGWQLPRKKWQENPPKVKDEPLGGWAGWGKADRVGGWTEGWGVGGRDSVGWTGDWPAKEPQLPVDNSRIGLAAAVDSNRKNSVICWTGHNGTAAEACMNSTAGTAVGTTVKAREHDLDIDFDLISLDNTIRIEGVDFLSYLNFDDKRPK